ncbi:MAG: hypothetical protein A2W22_01810 [Candidatus Levybacteria bacterium RBG_16_35_11]|nr:MAG: hypothetical protein A2W22_01810 [Candidatus Levybacteria bacterium RBG_16_35_11]
MTFIALRGNRESISQSSESYKNKIIEFMYIRGYLLTHDSAIDGILPDLIFNRPYIDGKKETWVESKFKDLSLKDTDFLSEFGRYFNGYLRRSELQRFKLFIFIRKCSAQSNWKNIFEETKGYPDDIKTLKQSIEDCLVGNDLEIFKRTSNDDFSFFINDVTIVEGGYEDVSRIADSLAETDKFNVEKSLLEDKSNLKNIPEVLTSNILKVTVFPRQLWVADAKENLDNEFWEENIDIVDLAYYYNKKIYSLIPISLDNWIFNYIKENTIANIELEKWKEDEYHKINILKYLIKIFIVFKGHEIGLWYDNYLNCLFFSNNKLQDEELKFRNRVVSRVYRKNGEINYVKHDALTVDVNYVSNYFYVIFNLIILFTKDGKEIIRGEQARALHYNFTKEYTFNNTEKSKLLYWINIFQLQNKTFSERESFLFSSPLTVSCPVSYEGGEIFDVTLLDFIKED